MVGRVDVDAMLAELSHREWLEWLWFIEENGIPEMNADGRILDLIIHLSNLNAGKKDKRQDFIYFTKERLEGKRKTDGYNPDTYEQRLKHAAQQMRGLAVLSGAKKED